MRPYDQERDRDHRDHRAVLIRFAKVSGIYILGTLLALGLLVLGKHLVDAHDDTIGPLVIYVGGLIMGANVVGYYSNYHIRRHW